MPDAFFCVSTNFCKSHFFTLKSTPQGATSTIVEIESKCNQKILQRKIF